MRHIKLALFGILAVMSVLWIAAEPGVFQLNGFFAVRAAAAQYTGVLAIAVMSVAMMLALRPRWPERWMGGLDKMYRLHKWLGITALVVAVIHWLWAQGPKWAVGWGLLERPARAANGHPSRTRWKPSFRACAAPPRASANGPSTRPWC